MGFKHLKVSMPNGPGSGRDAMKKNLELMMKFRELLGPDGKLMADVWMGWNETYAVRMTKMLAPADMYWLEEILPPYDYAGHARLREQIKSILVTTGEHEYGCHGFRQLMEHTAADIWNPDLAWAGGVTEVRKISAMASAYNIPVVMHTGADEGAIHVTMAVNSPMAEMYGPMPTNQFVEERFLTKGPEGIYTQPPDRPGFGWDFVVV